MHISSIQTKGPGTHKGGPGKHTFTSTVVHANWSKTPSPSVSIASEDVELLEKDVLDDENMLLEDSTLELTDDSLEDDTSLELDDEKLTDDSLETDDETLLEDSTDDEDATLETDDSTDETLLDDEELDTGAFTTWFMIIDVLASVLAFDGA